MDQTSEVVEDGSDLTFDETAAGIDVSGIRRSTRVCVPTERGLDYQLPLRKKNYNQCKKLRRFLKDDSGTPLLLQMLSAKGWKVGQRFHPKMDPLCENSQISSKLSLIHI